MMGATLPVLMMSLLIGSFQTARSHEPQSQSMAVYMAGQSFYPNSWATFMSSGEGEPDTFDGELIRNNTAVPRKAASLLSVRNVHAPNWAPVSLSSFWGDFEKSTSSSHHTSLAAIYQSVSSSHPASLAAFLSAKDPEAHLDVDKLVASSGLDRDEDMKLPDSSRSSPDLPVDGPHAQRFNVRSIDVEAAVAEKMTALKSAAIEQAPEDEAKSAATWASSVSDREASGVKGLYHDIVDADLKHKVADQWGEFAESGAAELARGLKNVAPKKVVKALHKGGKALHRDAVSRRPATMASTRHLSQTLEKYDEADDEGSSSFPDASSLPKLYLHHGRKNRAPQEEQQADHLRVNPDELVTVSEAAPVEEERLAPENPSSLARSLASDVEADKIQELKAHVDEKNRQAEAAEVPVEAPKEEDVSDNSPMSSVHHAHKLKLGRPEDAHHENATKASINTTGPIEATSANNVHEDVWPRPAEDYPLKSTKEKAGPAGLRGAAVPEEKIQGSAPSVKSDWDLQFNANAIDAHLDAKGIENVLTKMTHMKNPGSWNWRLFDVDGDGKLSQKEFMNLKQVAMRFSAKK